MKSLQSSETSVAIYQPTRRNIPEDPHILELRLHTYNTKYNPFMLGSEAAHYKLKMISITSRRP